MFRGNPSNTNDSKLPSLRGATAIITSVSTIVTAGNDVVWEDVQFDTDNIWDSSTNPERLTVPKWANFAKIVFAPKSSGTTPRWRLYKNGAVFVGDSFGGFDSSVDYTGNTSAWVPVSSGDYFTVYLVSGTGVSILQDAWVSIELKV